MSITIKCVSRIGRQHEMRGICEGDGPMANKFRTVPSWSKTMPVNGQGIFTFNITRGSPFKIVLSKTSTSDRIEFIIGDEFAELGITQNRKYIKLQRINQRHVGYEAGKTISYWFSCNRDGLVLKYGKGYTMEETTLVRYDFLEESTPEEQTRTRERLHSLFNAEDTGKVELYDARSFVSSSSPSEAADLIHNEKCVAFRKNPLICNLSPFVLDSSKATLLTLDSSRYMLSGSLPPACKELYDNIRNIELNWPPEVDDVLLSDAIRFSIETEGCLLNDKLKEKIGEFGKSSTKTTYLRVTLGHSLGNSPGIPYVLEIWPSKHHSPIHNHGNANAVIKVLFGQIHVSIYNKHVDRKPLKEFNAVKGDVTWISRDWFQRHKLQNDTDDFCATIQCYSYDAGDTTHWPHFDYVSENCTIEEFLPNSDFTFKYMRQKVLDEFRHGLNRCNDVTKTPLPFGPFGGGPGPAMPFPRGGPGPAMPFPRGPFGPFYGGSRRSCEHQ